MKFPNKETVEQLRREYPQGTLVELASMDDPYNSDLKPGERGEVTLIDDVGTIFVKWRCGSSLGVAYGVDTIRKLAVMSEEVIRSIQVVRLTGATNMFNWKTVLDIAEQCGFDELAEWLPNNVKAHSKYILTGETEYVL